jgi:hypothetical protein
MSNLLHISAASLNFLGFNHSLLVTHFRFSPPRTHRSHSPSSPLNLTLLFLLIRISSLGCELVAAPRLITHQQDQRLSNSCPYFRALFPDGPTMRVETAAFTFLPITSPSSPIHYLQLLSKYLHFLQLLSKCLSEWFV